MLKDTQINKYFGIPIRTIQDMKNADSDNWRFKVYTFLKNQDTSHLDESLSHLGLISSTISESDLNNKK